LAERLARLHKQAESDELYAQSTNLPEPAVRVWDEWPDKAKFWLIKAGLTRADLPGLGAYYHPPTERVVLPVLVPGRGAVFWQARSLDKRQPKYLAPGIGKKDAVPKYGRASMVTLTEDILSAYKVGLVAEGWALLGTSINHACLAALVERGQPVNLWLDPDDGGDRGRAKIAPAIRGMGLRVNIIHSKRDPKMMARHEIRGLLGML
jgi:DNA primase